MGTNTWDRRRFLLSAAGLVTAAACSNGNKKAGPTTSAGKTTTSTGLATPKLAADPFRLGVASGDPTHDSVILWTRLAPDPDNGGGMPDQDVPVRWEVGTTDTFSKVVTSGEAVALANCAHSVHVDATGLSPAQEYWYRFQVGDYETAPARTRTLPKADAAVDRFRLAFVSCQAYPGRYYTAHRALSEEDLDLVLHLGDYIYEGSGDGSPRQHRGPEPTTLELYRDRYALYKADADLQAAHAVAPWMVTWDDHEVENNYANGMSEDNNDGTIRVTEADFLKRRAAAYRAYWEHQPIRAKAPTGSDLKLYRAAVIGTLAHLVMLDGRQYRDDQTCDDKLFANRTECPEIDDPARTMLGKEQEAWFDEQLKAGAERTWQIIGQQTVMASLQVGELVPNFDQWDGYPEARRRLLRQVRDAKATGAVVLTGDIHLAGASSLPDPDGTSPIAAELVGTSITSGAPKLPVDDANIKSLFPAIEYFNSGDHGYCISEITADEWTARYQVVSSVTTPTATVRTDATASIKAGQPGLAGITR